MAESCDDCCDPIFSRSGLIDAHINVHFYFRKCRTIAHYRSRSRSRTRCRTSSQLSRTICQLLVITLDIYRKRDDDDAPRVLQLQQSCDKLNLLCHDAFGRVGKSLGGSVGCLVVGLINATDMSYESTRVIHKILSVA